MIPPDPVRISMVSSTAYLAIVRSAVEQYCRLLGFPEACTGNVVLAVDEAMTNIIRHAYGGREDGPIELTLSPLAQPGAPTALEVVLRDFGLPASAGAIRSRDLDDVRPGGLGVHIIQACMDSIEFQHPSDGGTRLRMVKGPPQADAPASPAGRGGSGTSGPGGGSNA